MKNPTRRMRRTIGKIARGIAQAPQKLELVAVLAREAASSPLKKDYSLAREILSRWFRRLILLRSRLGSAGFRRIITRPKQLLCIVLDDAVPNEKQQH
jgi:hypothetical protein